MLVLAQILESLYQIIDVLKLQIEVESIYRYLLVLLLDSWLELTVEVRTKEK